MRRTYRSKKESGNALDHRDVIQGLDEKSSVFSAFYIQSIKQTKRELSCIGSSTQFAVNPNKVYKKKHVKRILRQVERPENKRDSTSRSVFLTPDKSLRVNKPQDLFDQLLNSSSQSPKDSHFTGYGSNYLINAGKTYTRRKKLPNKKFNYSSEDSYDSDKENSSGSNAQCDVTDIKSHELLIERMKNTDDNYVDDSINNIVKKLSIFNKTHFNENKGLKDDTCRFNEKSSPALTKSPLCSTPYKDKYRGKSIYKFSPICLGKHEDSPEHHFILKEQYNSRLVNENKEFCSEECNPPSPIIQLSINKSSKIEKSSRTVSKIETELSSPLKKISRHEICETKSSVEQTNNLQTSEVEPLIGFTETKHSVESNCVSAREVISKDNKGILDENDIVELYDSENEISNKIFVDHNKIESPHILEQIDKSNINTSSDSSHSESYYDTCNSDESISSYNVVETAKYPVVSLERLNASILTKYLNKNNKSNLSMSDKRDSFDNNNLDESSILSNEFDNEPVSEDIESNINENHENDYFCGEEIKDIESERINSACVPEEDTDSSNMELNTSNNDDRCVSFVTTRRRNGATNNSIFDLNNSNYSTNSIDCDKTVLSNNIKLENNINCNDEDDTGNNNNDKIKEIALSSIESDTSNENRISNVTTRQSSRLTRHSDVASASRLSLFKTNDDDLKHGIMLQPGKKWERSLSIYKRMTMMTDHFDVSIIEDEQQTKGRKYRQSVISTMEMQDYRGSEHNESLISRRSTFVSKPSRSTIRLVKEADSSRSTLSNSTLFEDLKGFLSEDCDDTVVELSKLSIADSDHEITVLEKFHDTSNRVATARDYVLRRCCQIDAIPFDECYPDAVLKNCRKIGEGVYGEVFLWRAGDGRVRVLKIVPIAGTIKVNGEQQKDFHEIISEIVIAMELSALRTHIDAIQSSFDEGTTIDALDLHSVENASDVFNEVLAVRCVYGAYPSRLLDLWELYDECKGSENDNPAILPEDQQYIVLELANAGQDLESYEFNNAEQAHALFLQVAFGLAVAEEAFQFEHRDLHWGNVLIAPTEQKFTTFVLRGRAHRVARCGVAATVIDYSLSRVALPLAGGERAALYNDLARDDTLFDATGDYQFQVYRLMRDKLGNDWKNFEPYTNILWLHYTVDKMITALRYKRTNTKIHKHYIAKLKGIKNRIVDYGSAAQFVLTDNEF